MPEAITGQRLPRPSPQHPLLGVGQKCRIDLGKGVKEASSDLRSLGFGSGLQGLNLTGL